MNIKERLFLLKISVIVASRMLGLFMIFPVFVVYAQYYNKATLFLIGVAIGIYGLTQAILQIPFGYLSDIYGRKKIIIIGLIIFFIGSIIAANTTDIIWLIIGRAVQGGGAISAVLMAFLADCMRESQRSKANAFIGMQIGLMFMLSILIAPIITSNLGISGLFWVISALSVVALIVAISLPHHKPQKQYKFSITNIKKILTINLLSLDLSIFALHLILTCIFITIPIILVYENIVSIADNWKIYLPVMLLSFAIMLPIIILAQKFNKTKTMLLIAIFIILLTQILFYGISIPHQQLITLNRIVFLILLTLFFTAFNIIEATLPALIAKTVDYEKRGLAMGFFSTSQFLGIFSGGILGGAVYNIFGLNSVFLLTIFIATVWWLIIFKISAKTTL